MMIRIFILLLIPIASFSQVNPFNCNYDIIDDIRDTSKVKTKNYVTLIKGLTKQCVQNDLEYSRDLNQTIFRNLTNQHQFTLIVKSFGKVEQDQLALFVDKVLKIPIEEDYEYKSIIDNISNWLDTKESDHDSLLIELKAIYLDSIGI